MSLLGRRERARPFVAHIQQAAAARRVLGSQMGVLDVR